MTILQQIVSKVAEEIYDLDQKMDSPLTANEVIALAQVRLNQRNIQGVEPIDDPYDPRRSTIVNLIEDVFLGRTKSLIGETTTSSDNLLESKMPAFVVGRFYFFN